MKLFKLLTTIFISYLASFAKKSPESSQKLCAKLCKILNIEIRCSRPVPSVHVFANHQGWLDVLVLGSLNPYRFIAKSEVTKMPVVGRLAKEFHTLFVQRGVTLSRQPELMAEMETSSRPIVCFPEGTTNKEIGKLKQGILSFIEKETTAPAIALHMKFTPQEPALYLRNETLLQNLMKLFWNKKPIIVEIDWCVLDRDKGRFTEQTLFFFKTMEQSRIDF